MPQNRNRRARASQKGKRRTTERHNALRTISPCVHRKYCEGKVGGCGSAYQILSPALHRQFSPAKPQSNPHPASRLPPSHKRNRKPRKHNQTQTQIANPPSSKCGPPGHLATADTALPTPSGENGASRLCRRVGREGVTAARERLFSTLFCFLSALRHVGDSKG